MPTLLQINVTANWGSTGKIAELIGAEAIARGWRSYIAYGRTCKPSQSALIKIGGRINTYYHYLSQRLFDNEGLCSTWATKRLIKKIKEISPDIVHLHNIHDHYLNYPILFRFLNSTNIKVVWTMHDFWAITGHCMHFTNAKCDKYMTGCDECPMRHVYPKSVIDRSSRNYKLKRDLFSANSNLNIVTVSQWVANVMEDSFLGKKPIQVINNGINLEDFKPTDNGHITARFKDKFVILSVSSQWKHDKGLEDYLKISKLLSDDEVIVLVGVDDEIIKRLPNNIIGIKVTTNTEELAALYTRANVLTVLSSAETFGLTVVEAYACGTPAVVYDNTAPPALITKDTGMVVNNHDYKAAYDAILHIKSLGKSRFQAPCINLAREKYDKKICINKYFDLYQQILNN